MGKRKKIYTREDSSIRAEGAEIFVHSILMLEFGIITSLASRSMPDYDLIAHNLKKKIDCRISVKYRKANNSDGFRFKRIKNFDYFVGVLGKRGKIGVHDDDSSKSLKQLAECYILSRREVQSNCKKMKRYILVPRNKKILTEQRLYNWNKIISYLKV